MTEPLIYELSSPGREGVKPPQLDVPESALPRDWLRADLPLPEVSEIDVVRHYLRLSQLNYAIDKGMYPSLLHYEVPQDQRSDARLPGFTGASAATPDDVQGRCT